MVVYIGYYVVVVVVCIGNNWDWLLDGVNVGSLVGCCDCWELGCEVFDVVGVEVDVWIVGGF